MEHGGGAWDRPDSAEYPLDQGARLDQTWRWRQQKRSHAACTWNKPTHRRLAKPASAVMVEDQHSPTSDPCKALLMAGGVYRDGHVKGWYQREQRARGTESGLRLSSGPAAKQAAGFSRETEWKQGTAKKVNARGGPDQRPLQGNRRGPEPDVM